MMHFRCAKSRWSLTYNAAVISAGKSINIADDTGIAAKGGHGRRSVADRGLGLNYSGKEQQYDDDKTPHRQYGLNFL
jgi:hypothetical protein